MRGAHRRVALVPPDADAHRPLLERSAGLLAGEGIELVWGPDRQALPAAPDLLVLPPAGLDGLHGLAAAPLRRPPSAAPPPLALWGDAWLGPPLQALSTWQRGLARRALARAEWCFADTATGRDLLLADGFPAPRITLLDDRDGSAALEALLDRLPADTLARQRERLQLGAGPVALLLGALRGGPRLQTLLDAARLAQRRCPGLVLLVVGDGAGAPLLQQARAQAPWIRWWPTAQLRDVAAALRLADLLLLPHGDGLGARRATLAGLPVVAFAAALAEDADAVLVPHRNAVVAHRDSPAAVAAALLAALDPRARQVLHERCRGLPRRHGLAPIAARLAAGLRSALHHAAAPGRARVSDLVSTPV